MRGYSSLELAKRVGNAIDRKVNLKFPDIELFIEARGNETYIYSQKFRGLGGLPLGTQGRVIALISGGIDSPVAAWMMMKRGLA